MFRHSRENIFLKTVNSRVMDPGMGAAGRALTDRAKVVWERDLLGCGRFFVFARVRFFFNVTVGSTSGASDSSAHLSRPASGSEQDSGAGFQLRVLMASPSLSVVH